MIYCKQKSCVGENFFSFSGFSISRESFNFPTNFISGILSANIYAKLFLFLLKAKPQKFSLHHDNI